MNSTDPISDILLERKLISALLRGGETLLAVIDHPISPESFTDPSCQIAFSELHRTITISEAGALPDGLQSIARGHGLEIARVPRATRTVISWVERLQSLKSRRDLAELLERARQKVTSPNCPLRPTLEGLISELDRHATGAASNPTPLKDTVFSILTELEDLYAARGKPPGISTGFPQLDTLTSGFLPGKLYVILGEAGEGKTALAINMAAAALRGDDGRVGFSMGGCPPDDVMRPLLMQVSSISLQRVMEGYMVQRDFDALTAAATRFANGAVDFRSRQRRTLRDIQRQAVHLANRIGISLLLIDDAHALACAEAPVETVCRELRRVAQANRIPIVAFCRTSDDDESSGWDRLFELDADLVAALYHDEEDNVALDVLRNVGRGIGTVWLTFDGGTLTFSEHDHKEANKENPDSGGEERSG